MKQDRGTSRAKAHEHRQRWLLVEVPLTERQWAYLVGMGNELVAASGNGSHLNEAQRVGGALNTLVDLWVDLQTSRDGAMVQ